ncbi:hypothetical protein HK101_004983, partial [Irineochytrium annulatum]
MMGMLIGSSQRQTTSSGMPLARGEPPSPVGPHISLCDLPDELLILILSHCRPADLCTLSRSGRRLACLADLDDIWAPIAFDLYRPKLDSAAMMRKGGAPGDGDRDAVLPEAGGDGVAGPDGGGGGARGGAEEEGDIVMGGTAGIVADDINATERDDPCSLPPSLPTKGFKSFLARLSAGPRCFRCGVDASDRTVLGGSVGVNVVKTFKRRYCKQCQKTELVTKTEARDSFLLTEKQLAQLNFVTKPWYNKTCFLYLRSHVSDMALQKHGSRAALDRELDRRRRRALEEAAARFALDDEEEDPLLSTFVQRASSSSSTIDTFPLRAPRRSAAIAMPDTQQPRRRAMRLMTSMPRQFDDDATQGEWSPTSPPIDFPVDADADPLWMRHASPQAAPPSQPPLSAGSSSSSSSSLGSNSGAPGAIFGTPGAVSMDMAMLGSSDDEDQDLEEEVEVERKPLRAHGSRRRADAAAAAEAEAVDSPAAGAWGVEMPGCGSLPDAPVAPKVGNWKGKEAVR